MTKEQIAKMEADVAEAEEGNGSAGVDRFAVVLDTASVRHLLGERQNLLDAAKEIHETASEMPGHDFWAGVRRPACRHRLRRGGSEVKSRKWWRRRNKAAWRAKYVSRVCNIDLGAIMPIRLRNVVLVFDEVDLSRPLLITEGVVP